MRRKLTIYANGIKIGDLYFEVKDTVKDKQIKIEHKISDDNCISLVNTGCYTMGGN